MTPPPRRIGPEDVLTHMEVPGETGLFVLGCFERRVTLYSQQVRALNLVYALREEKALKAGDEVAVVGGSVAGMTAAAGAARLGCKVTLLEKKSVLLPLLRGNHTRWVYPHLYDWPEEGSEDPRAGLPLLDWRADLANRVADQLDEVWEKLPERSRIEVVTSVSSIHLGAGAPRSVTWNAPGPKRGRFAAVILAVGFGLERQVAEAPWVSYWQDDALHQSALRGPERHLISGCGDGGLIDLLRVCVQDFRHEDLIERFLERVPEGLRKRLLEIDEEARHARDPGDHLFAEYEKLDAPEVDAAFEPLRTDKAAVLNGREESPFTLGASILNRFLVSRLLLHFGVPYRPGEISVRRAGERYEVAFASGKAETFDHVTCRHGTAPPALEESFADVWAKCEPLRARSGLDQTRWPIYGKAFDLEPSGGGATPTGGAGAGGAPFFGVRRESLGDGFKGREKDLVDLHAALAGSGSVALRSGLGRVYAHGGGGIGKTRLAIEYASRHRAEYPGGVFFAVVAERPPLAVLAELGRQRFGEGLTRDDDAAYRFATWLGDAAPGRRLLVLDDVQGEWEDVARRFRERVEVRGQVVWPLVGLPHVAVLMTTRLHEIPGARAFPVRHLDAEGALALLLDKAGKQVHGDEEKAARALASEDLGGHALAISLAGAYVRRARLSFAEYRDALRDKGVIRKLEEAAKRVGVEIDDHEVSIRATYDLSRERLDPTKPEDALAWRILTIAACLAPNEPIDRRLVQRLLGKEGAAADLEEIGLAESRLLDLSLLDADSAGCREGDVVIHPLVAEYTRTVLADAERVRVQGAVLRGLTGLFPGRHEEYWRITQPNASHGWEWLSPAREAHALAAWVRNEILVGNSRCGLGLDLGDLYRIRGDVDRALEAYRVAVDLAERLVEQAPDDVTHQRQLLVSHVLVGDVMLAKGDSAGALASFRTILAIAERLAKQDPENANPQRDLRVSHNKIGDVLLAQGDETGALASYRTALVIAERLTERDSRDTLWQRDLAVTHTRIGDVLSEQGNTTDALAALREAFFILDRLAKQEPDNALWQRDLATLHNNIGGAQRAQGDAAGALASFRAAVAISERLARQDPSHVRRQTGLALYSANVARTLSRDTPAERAEARSLLERAVSILRTLAAASRLTHEQQHRVLPEYEAALKALPP